MSTLERLKRVNARGIPEESVRLRIAVLVAVMASALAVLAQGVGGIGLRLGVAAIPGAFWFSHRYRHGEGYLLKAGLAIGVLAAFAAFLASLDMVHTGSIASLQVPLAELFLWVQLLHSLDVPARRDLMFSVASSLVLMGVAGALSISMNLVVYLLVWAVAAVVSLVLAHRSELEELTPLRPMAGTPDVAPIRSPRVVLKPVLALVSAVTVLGAAAFVVLPPAGEARAFTFPTQLAKVLPLPSQGGLANPSLGDGDPARRAGQQGTAGSGGRSSFGYMGFSDSLDTAVRGRPDDTLVMRVRASRPDFWRGQTFDVWDGQQWTLSDDRPVMLPGHSPVYVAPVPGEDDLDGGHELVQTYYLKRPGPNLIFGASRVTRLYFPDRRVFQLSDGSLRAGVFMEKDTVYTVVSRRLPVTPDILRVTDVARGSTPPYLLERYLQLPRVPQRVVDLAEKVTADAPTVYDKIRALEAWMGRNTRYSLDIPPLPRTADAVEHFLFEERVGFCEQIASSLVVMLRSLGIPSRVAVGYTPGQRNPFTGLYEVRAKDAHSWAEVWFPGIGWQGFDPTANVPLAGDGGLSRASSGIGAYLASKIPFPPRWAVTGGVVLAIAVFFVTGTVSGLRAFRARRRRRAERTWADVCLERLERAGAAAGRPRSPSETVRDYAAALRRGVITDDRLDQAATIVMRDAFSGSPVSDEERRLVEKVLEDVGAR